MCFDQKCKYLKKKIGFDKNNDLFSKQKNNK